MEHKIRVAVAAPSNKTGKTRLLGEIRGDSALQPQGASAGVGKPQRAAGPELSTATQTRSSWTAVRSRSVVLVVSRQRVRMRRTAAAAAAGCRKPEAAGLAASACTPAANVAASSASLRGDWSWIDGGQQSNEGQKGCPHPPGDRSALRTTASAAPRRGDWPWVRTASRV